MNGEVIVRVDAIKEGTPVTLYSANVISTYPQSMRVCRVALCPATSFGLLPVLEMRSET